MVASKQVFGQNPKDLVGVKKVDLSLFPSIAHAHGAHAFMDGARKYGPYNWRENAVLARIYLAAAKRHLDYWEAGEETAKDSGVHHLGHAMACLAILLDAQATGNLIDNRPKSPDLIKAFDALNDAVKAAQEALAKASAPQAQPVAQPAV
ncbi:dATP/dGTP diphosphohydrolase domain-containing protein [Bradyrhizobium sp. Tv2a-2]|uniref:dATP/dGTP diphosphohydrolase domain-containing protein n=1 Tax=Bradyrhizobium sp. Tv2a-2 TaxID=113395 RepID=UPI0003F72F47|nr:dATP/dGTP diphosphohydrolase domain-containing protein [Bradyrhizobium sp. Tv2a-2]